MSNALYSSIISLTLLVIIALLGAGIRVAEATAMWGAAVCSSSSGISTDSRPTSPGTFTANNCRFSTTFVTVSAASIVGPSSSATSFVIDLGTVLAGISAGIGIEGPTASAAPSKGPLKISVTRTTFGLDAVLVFTGAIPPRSSITLSGNSFSLSSLNANIGGSFTALLIASSTLSLSGGSQLSVNDNTFRAPSTSNFCIRCSSSNLTLADGSLANMSGNWLGGVNGPATGSVNLIYFVFTEVTLSGGSGMRFDNNGISNIESQTLTIVSWSHSTSNFALQLSDGSVISQSGNSVSNVVTHPNSFVYIAIWYYPATSLDVSLACGSRIIISNNSIVNATLGDAPASAYIHVVYWRALTDSTVSLAQNSSLTLGHNVVSNSNIASGSYIYCVRFKFDGPLQLSVLSSSTVNMDDNTISHSRTNSFIFVVELISPDMVVTVANHSTLSLSRNMAERTQSGTYTIAVYFTVGYALQQSTLLNSQLRMDGNSIVNSTAGNYILAVSAVHTSFLVSLNSTFTTNSNIVTGANSTGGYVRCVMVWRGASPPMAITVSNSSQLLINNNTITNSISVTDAVCVTFSTVGSTSSTTVIISLTSDALLDVSGNSVLNTTVITNTHCLFMEPLALAIANGSRFIVSGNTIANNAARSWSLARICHLALNSTMSRSTLLISNNTILNTDTPDIAVADLRLSQLSMAQGSSITIANNTLVFTEIGSRVAYIGVLSISPSFTASPLVSLSAGSSITIAGNSVAITTPIQQSYLLNATVVISLSLSQVLVHSNSLYARLLGGPALGVVHLSDVVTISGSGLAFTENSILVGGECQPFVRIPNLTSIDDGSLNISGNFFSLNITSAECAFFDLGSLAGGRLIVTANTITSTVPLVTLRATSLAIAAGGSLFISSNVVEFTSNISSGGLMIPGSLSIGPMAELMFYNNTVLGPGGPFLIVNATSAPSLGAGSSVAICGNTVFGDLSSSLMPDRYIAPPSLLRVIVGCRTVSSSASFTERTSESYSLATSQSYSTTQSLSDRSSSPTFSKSASASNSMSISGTPSAGTATGSASPSTSRSASESRSTSLSFRTATSSESVSSSFTCQGLGGLTSADTCKLFRALPVTDVILAAVGSPVTLGSDWLLGYYQCTSITIPFSLWRGRPGSHTIAVVAVDSRAPFTVSLVEPAISGAELIRALPVEPVDQPITLLFASVENISSAVASGRLPGPPRTAPTAGMANATYTFPAAVATMEYFGPPTLNRLQYRLDGGAWARCPVPVSVLFTVTLEGSERLFPVALSEAVAVGTAVFSVAGGLTVTPSSVAQLGVASSLRKMSRCAGMSLDDADDDDSYADFAAGAANPLALTIGSLGGGRRYVRGALSTSVVYFVAMSLLMLSFTACGAWIKARVAGSPLPIAALHGYPSALVAVASFVMDGAAAAGTVLGVYGDGWGDRALGIAAVAACAAFVCHILWVSTARFPPALVAAATADDEPHADHRVPAFRLRLAWRWLSRATHRWAVEVPDDEQKAVSRVAAQPAEAWLARYESYVADARLRWYCGLEQAVALLLCVLGSLAFADMAFCVARGVLCVLLLGLQAAVMVALRPLVHRWRWLLMCAVLPLQVLTAALSVANAPLQEQGIELAMDATGSVIFVLLAGAFVADAAVLLRDLYRSALGVALLVRRRQGSSDPGSTSDPLLADAEMEPTAGLPLPLESVSVSCLEVPPLPLPAEDAHEGGEGAIVRAILRQFREYEQEDGRSTIDQI